MSKIQFNELNNSELEVLNTQETAEVVGGFFVSYTDIFSFSSKYASVYQSNFNDNDQAAFGGGSFSSNGNSNNTSQGNNLNINQ